jgi:hypothetical protein
MLEITPVSIQLKECKGLNEDSIAILTEISFKGSTSFGPKPLVWQTFGERRGVYKETCRRNDDVIVVSTKYYVDNMAFDQ